MAFEDRWPVNTGEFTMEKNENLESHDTDL